MSIHIGFNYRLRCTSKRVEIFSRPFLSTQWWDAGESIDAGTGDNATTVVVLVVLLLYLKMQRMYYDGAKLIQVHMKGIVLMDLPLLPDHLFSCITQATFSQMFIFSLSFLHPSIISGCVVSLVFFFVFPFFC